MIEVKEGERPASACALYTAALRADRRRTDSHCAPTNSAGLLGAADGLEKRARAIHERPIDEGTLARVPTIRLA